MRRECVEMRDDMLDAPRSFHVEKVPTCSLSAQPTAQRSRSCALIAISLILSSHHQPLITSPQQLGLFLFSDTFTVTSVSCLYDTTYQLLITPLPCFSLLLLHHDHQQCPWRRSSPPPLLHWSWQPCNPQYLSPSLLLPMPVSSTGRSTGRSRRGQASSSCGLGGKTPRHTAESGR